MIYGERMFAFNEEASIDEIEYESKGYASFDDMLNGFSAVCALAEATDNYGLLDTYADLLEESSVEILEEGANAEYTKIFKEKFKAIKECTKNSRKAFKAEDYKQAKEYCKQGIKLCEELKKEFDMERNLSESEVDKVDDTVLTAILGFIINNFISTLGLLIPLVGPFVTLVHGIKAQIKIMKQWKEEGFNAKTANVYRNKLEFGIGIMKEDFEAAIKAADDAMKNNK